MNKELREIKESVEPTKTSKFVNKVKPIKETFTEVPFICTGGTPPEDGTYVVYFTDGNCPCVDIMTWNGSSHTFEQEVVDWYNEDYSSEYFHLNEIDGFFKIPEPGWNKKTVKTSITEFMRDNINLSDEEFEKKFNETFRE